MPDSSAKQSKKIQELTFKYVIPENLCDCYINGAYGGVTPRNEISMHLYCERHPIPNSISHKINKDGTLSKEHVEIKGGDIVRLVQSSVIMDLSTAVAIRDWLNEKIRFIEEKDKIQKSENKSKGRK